MAPNPAEGVAGAAPRRAVCRRSNPTACALSVLRNEFFDNRPLGRYRLDLSVRLRRGGVLLAAVQAVAVVVVLTALFLAPLRSTEHQRTPADRSDRPTDRTRGQALLRLERFAREGYRTAGARILGLAVLLRSTALAIVGQMSASHPTLPKDRKHRDSAPRQASRQGSADEWTLVEFRPARWLVSALTLLALWLGGAKLGKRGLLALAWRFAPRRVRLVAGGVAAVALVVLAGSVAALALALTQLV